MITILGDSKSASTNGSRGSAEPLDSAAFERSLRAAVRGDIHFEDGYRAMYATDASNYRQVPLCVVLPRDKDDLERAVRVAYEHAVPIVHRGGGTSLAGETCNTAMVIDSSKYMNRIVSIDYENLRAVVEPGLVLDDLRDAVKPRGLTFGCAPSTHNRCTLGGMIGNNSCGMPAQMAGKTEESVFELEVLTYDGLRMRVGPTSEEDLAAVIAAGGRKGEIFAGLKAIRDRYAQLIKERFPEIPRRVSGFALNELLDENGFNVARALVGTEGTCVSILEATVRLVPDAPHKAFALLGFENIPTAADHVALCNEHNPTALEGMDSTLFQLMDEKGKSTYRKDELFPGGAAWLIVQFGAETRDEAQQKAEALIAQIERESERVRGTRAISDPETMHAIIAMREAGLGVTSKIPDKPDFYPGWEDAAVPAEHLGEYLREFLKKLEEYHYEASIYGHFGQGCVHCSINFDLFTKRGIEDYRRFVHEMAHICVKYGGSLSGEHGDGQARGELLPIMYGEELVQAFWEFKTLWDPGNKMNPGKVVHPARLDEHLRWGVDYEPSEPTTKFTFKEDRHSFAYAANRCVGAGVCRKHDQGTMCPSYMVTKEEKYSTRGRARLLFEMLQGEPLSDGWKSEEVRESLDFCLACKGCKHECPVNVDMATYKAEFLYHYFQGKVRPLKMWLFGYMFNWAKLASRMPKVANFFTQAPPFSTIAKRLASMAPQREIPMFADRTFRQWFAGHAARNPSGKPVLLWTDTWNEHFHPHTAQAAVEVLEDAGYRVMISDRQQCCGRPLYDYGLLDQAERQLRSILDDLRPLLREGVPIIGLEPSCISVFKDEMQNMLGNDPDAIRFGSQCFMLETFLKERAENDDGYSPPKLARHALVHEHCHKKALLEPGAETHIFSQMGLDVEKMNSGCCGMAGAFGFEEAHYDMSIKCGERVLLPKVRAAKPQSVIVADGFSCREQIAQTTQRQALHPAEVLAMAIADRGRERDDAFPERRYMPDVRKRRAEIVAQGYLAMGAACAIALLCGAAWLAKRGK